MKVRDRIGVPGALVGERLVSALPLKDGPVGFEGDSTREVIGRRGAIVHRLAVAAPVWETRDF